MVHDTENIAEEIEFLNARIVDVGDRTILVREVSNPSPFQTVVLFARITELSDRYASFSLVIDLSEATRPNAERRALIQKCFNQELRDKVDHLAIFTGKNFLLNTVTKFVLYGLRMRSTSVHKTEEQALCATKEAG